MLPEPSSTVPYVYIAVPELVHNFSFLGASNDVGLQ
jgi:hypothetical protein